MWENRAYGYSAGQAGLGSQNKESLKYCPIAYTATIFYSPFTVISKSLLYMAAGEMTVSFKGILSP